MSNFSDEGNYVSTRDSLTRVKYVSKRVRVCHPCEKKLATFEKVNIDTSINGNIMLYVTLFKKVEC